MTTEKIRLLRIAVCGLGVGATVSLLVGNISKLWEGPTHTIAVAITLELLGLIFWVATLGFIHGAGPISFLRFRDWYRRVGLKPIVFREAEVSVVLREIGCRNVNELIEISFDLLRDLNRRGKVRVIHKEDSIVAWIGDRPFERTPDVPGYTVH